MRQILVCTLFLSLSGWGNAAESSPEAQAIIQKMIEAHGGMDTWASAPTVTFRDHFKSAKNGQGSPSWVTVEQSSRRAYLTAPGSSGVIAWDGKKAWGLSWPRPTYPRFLALLNYYFANLPWLTQDPGVVLGEPTRQKLWNSDTEWIAIRMGFESGVGDTPEDYYLLFIDPVTYQLHACEYIVTYKALLPEGVSSTNPHTLIYEAWDVVDGLLVPVQYTIYDNSEEHPALYVCELRGWSFERIFQEWWMDMPEGAAVDQSQP